MKNNPPSFYQLAKQSKWILIGIIVLGLSLIFFRLDVEERRYEGEGQRVQGIVLSKAVSRGTSASRGTSSTTSYYVMYKFTTKEGQTIEGKDDVFPNTWRTLKEGGTVEVEYLPNSPDTNRIPGETAKSSTYKNIGRFLFLASAVILLIGLRKVYVKFRLLREPTNINGGRAIE